ncbi:MAG: hypothetical protein U1C74_09255 [Phenylobacterium sp.]|nr:hypothetical protein [Phenylobacterium sp.]
MMDHDAGPPLDADHQRLDALQRDLLTAVDRAIAAGAAPPDVLTCLGLTVGDVLERMAVKPSASELADALRSPVATGQRVAAARIAAKAATPRVYGGEARLRRARP